MDYNNIILMARERHAELIKDAQDNARYGHNSHVVTVPNIIDRAAAGLKAIFAKPANVAPTVKVSRTLATK